MKPGILGSLMYATVQKLPATKLTENTAVGVRKWYENLTRTLHDHGVYVHPFWAFRTQCDHRWGFEVQNAANQADKDIPYEMQDIMNTLSGAVHAHVTKSGTFSKDCELNDLAAACF